MPIDLAIVPVAGQGTGLLPLTKSQPKEMLPVGHKPVVQYVVEELAQAGIRRVIFVTGPGKTSIENHFDINWELISYLRETGKEERLAELDYERRELEYFYTRQRRQLGLGHAVLCARSLLGNEPFVVALGDSIIGPKAHSQIVRRMVAEFERLRADVVVALEEVPEQEVVYYGIAKPGRADGELMELEDLVEKPQVHEAPSNLAAAARYVCSPRLFEFLAKTAPSKAGTVELTDAIRLLMSAGGKVYGIRLPAGERRFDIGSFESYFRAFTEFVLDDPRYGPSLRNHVRKLLESAR